MKKSLFTSLSLFIFLFANCLLNTVYAQTCSQLSIGLGTSNTNPCLNANTSFWKLGDWQLQNNVKWFVDNVQVGTGSNLNYSFIASGSHVVKIQGSTSDNSCTKSNTLTVNVASNVGAVSGLTTVNAGQQGVVYSVPSMGSGTYNWHTTTDAQIVSGQGTNSVTVNFGNGIGSSFQIVAQHTSTSGCNSTSSLTVQKGTVIDCNSLSLGIGVSTQPPCLGQNTSFWMTGSSTLQSNLTWYINNVQVGTGENLNYTFASAGTYTIKLVGKTAGNTCIKENTTSVTVLPTVGPISGATTVSPNSNQTYTVPNMGAGTYNWWHTTDAHITSGQNTSSATYHFGNSITNSSTVNVGYTSTNGCYTERSLTLNKIEPCIDSTLNAYVRQYSIRLSAKQRFSPNCKTITKHTFPFEVYFDIPSQITISRTAKIGDKAYLVVEKGNKLDTLVYQLQTSPATNVLPFSSSTEGSQTGSAVATKRVDFWLETINANGDLISKELINTTQAINARLEIPSDNPITFNTCTNNTLRLTVVNPQTEPYPQGNRLTLRLNPNVEYIGFASTDFESVPQIGQELVFRLTRQLEMNQSAAFSYTVRPACGNFINTSTAVQDQVTMEPISEIENTKNIVYTINSPIFNGFSVVTTPAAAFYNVPFEFSQTHVNSSINTSFSGQVRYDLTMPTGFVFQNGSAQVTGGNATNVIGSQTGNVVTIVADIPNLGSGQTLRFSVRLLTERCAGANTLAAFNSSLSLGCATGTLCPYPIGQVPTATINVQTGTSTLTSRIVEFPGAQSLSCATVFNGQMRTYQYEIRNTGQIAANNIDIYPFAGLSKNFVPVGGIRCTVTTVPGIIPNRPATIIGNYVAVATNEVQNTNCLANVNGFQNVLNIQATGNASTRSHIRIPDLFPGEIATLEVDVFSCCPNPDMLRVNLATPQGRNSNAYSDIGIIAESGTSNCPRTSTTLMTSNPEGILLTADNIQCPVRDVAVDQQFNIRLPLNDIWVRFPGLAPNAINFFAGTTLYQDRAQELRNSNIVVTLELEDGLAYMDGANAENRMYFQSGRDANRIWLPSVFNPTVVTRTAQPRFGPAEQRNVTNRVEAIFSINDIWDTQLGEGSLSQFFNTTEFVYRMQGYCPILRAPRYTLRLFYQPNGCDATCRIPLLVTQCTVNVNCPGCRVPGAIVNAFDIRRTTFGFADNNNNSLPDDGLAGAPTNPIQLTSANAPRAIRTDRVVTGDHLAMTGSCNMNRDLIRYDAQFPFRIPNLYLLQFIPFGDMLDVLSYTVTVTDRNTNNVVVVADIPRARVQTQRVGTNHFFLYDFSVATLRQFQRGNTFVSTEFNDNWNVVWEADLVKTRNASVYNNNTPAEHIAPVTNQMFFTGVAKNIGEAIADFNNRPTSLIGAGVTNVNDIVPEDQNRWLMCELINGEITMTGFTTELVLFTNFVQDANSGNNFNQGCTKTLTVNSNVSYAGRNGDTDYFPFEFRPLPVPENIAAHWPAGYKLDRVSYDQVSDWRQIQQNGNREKLPQDINLEDPTLQIGATTITADPRSFFTFRDNYLPGTLPTVDLFSRRDKAMRLLTTFQISGQCGITPEGESTDYGVSATWGIPNAHTDVFNNTTGRFIFPAAPDLNTNITDNTLIEPLNNRFEVPFELQNNGVHYAQNMFTYLDNGSEARATEAIFNFDGHPSYLANADGFIPLYSTNPLRPTPTMLLNNLPNSNATNQTRGNRLMTIRAQLNRCTIGQDNLINIVVGSACERNTNAQACSLSSTRATVRVRLRSPLPELVIPAGVRTTLNNCDAEFFTFTVNNAVGAGWLKSLNPTVAFSKAGLEIVNNNCTLTVVTNDVPAQTININGAAANPTLTNGIYSWNSTTIANLGDRGVQRLTIRYQLRTVCNGPTGDVVQYVKVEGANFCNSPTAILPNDINFNIAPPADRDQLAVSIVNPATIQNCSTVPVNIQVTVKNNGTASTQRSNVLSLTGTGLTVATAAFALPTIVAGGSYSATFTVQPSGTILQAGTTFPLAATLTSTSQATSTCSTTCVKSENFSATGSVVAEPCQPVVSLCGHTFSSNGTWVNGNTIPAVLGDPTTTTTYTGGGTFSGTYLVDGTIELKDGTYTVLPGTVFYVKGKNNYPNDVGTYITGDDGLSQERFISPYIVFRNSSVDIKGTLFKAACDNMWGGIWLNDQVQLNMETSTVQDANVGIGMHNNLSPSNPGFKLNVDKSTFFNNGNAHISSYRGKMNGEVSVTNSRFESEIGTLLPPFSSPDAFTDYGTLFNDNTSSLVCNDNVYSNLYIAITSFSETATINRNSISKVSGRGIEFYPQLSSNVSDNMIDLRPDPTNQNDKKGITIFHCVSPSQTHTFSNNTIEGLSNTKYTGFYRYDIVGGDNNTYRIEHNKMNNLRDGVYENGIYNCGCGPNLQIVDNLFNYCSNGVFFPENTAMLTSIVLECNKFDNTAGLANAQAVYIGDGTVLPNDLGSNISPAGNKFTNYSSTGTNALNNANTSLSSNFRYYYYEPEGIPKVSGFVTPTESPISPSCSSRGYANGNFRMEDDIALKQDNLRHKNGTGRELRKYEGNIINYYTDANDLSGLEQYTYSLVNCNRGAYYRLCFYLMEHYGNLVNTTQAEAWKQAALQPNPNHAYVKSYTDWFTLKSHNPFLVSSPMLMATFSMADSTLLASIATSGTPFALNACMILQRAYPNYFCQYQSSQTTSLDDNTQCDAQANFRSSDEESADKKFGGQTWLGTAYPNPAKSDVTINYNLPNKQSMASIRLHEIATGKLAAEFSIVSGESFINIPVSELISGMYTYTLIVDGVPFKSKSLAVIR